MNLTLAQKVALLLITLNVLAGGTAQLTVLIGQGPTSLVTALCTLAGTIVGGWVFVLTGQQNLVNAVGDLAKSDATIQKSLVKTVASMEGIERISINAGANQALAQVAVDPNQPRVGATTSDVREVLKTTAADGPNP